MGRVDAHCSHRCSIGLRSLSRLSSPVRELRGVPAANMEDDRPTAARVDLEEAEEDALPDWSRFAAFAK